MTKLKGLTDNQGTIAIAKKYQCHKEEPSICIFIIIMCMCVCEAQKGLIILQYCHTNSMTADLLTKPPARNHFEMSRTFNLGRESLESNFQVELDISDICGLTTVDSFTNVHT